MAGFIKLNHRRGAGGTLFGSDGDSPGGQGQGLLVATIGLQALSDSLHRHLTERHLAGVDDNPVPTVGRRDSQLKGIALVGDAVAFSPLEVGVVTKIVGEQLNDLAAFVDIDHSGVKIPIALQKDLDLFPILVSILGTPDLNGQRGRNSREKRCTCRFGLVGRRLPFPQVVVADDILDLGLDADMVTAVVDNTEILTFEDGHRALGVDQHLVAFQHEVIDFGMRADIGPGIGQGLLLGIVESGGAQLGYGFVLGQIGIPVDCLDAGALFGGRWSDVRRLASSRTRGANGHCQQ